MTDIVGPMLQQRQHAMAALLQKLCNTCWEACWKLPPQKIKQCLILWNCSEKHNPVTIGFQSPGFAHCITDVSQASVAEVALMVCPLHLCGR